MDAWTAITSRRDVRTYSDQRVSAAELDQILEAARRAPSAGNHQPWDLVVVTDNDRLDTLASACGDAPHVARAPVVVAVVAPKPESERRAGFIQFDLGQMTMQLMIAAAGLGIGTAHAFVEDQELARRVLGFPEDRMCQFLIAMGYPSDRPLQPLTKVNRRPFEDVVHRERF